ncbi:hypothetical protein FISHEDRAFT_74756 [Fistulina hepatica ATCC 64428]|uniref:Uncharacterized protein n=1 Tax=Fistulina hepatica ATCC 64428 TaxID=1128425 RepID=A0A0D7A9F6_9AGAR|nr:hypothetical protein FISHEDRAFT_74756 [Fistulina hepatica ATCC 64428]
MPGVTRQIRVTDLRSEAAIVDEPDGSMDGARQSSTETIVALLHGRDRADIPIENEFLYMFIPVEVEKKGEQGEEPFHNVVLFLDSPADVLLIGSAERALIVQAASLLCGDPCVAEEMGFVLSDGSLFDRYIHVAQLLQYYIAVTPIYAGI